MRIPITMPPFRDLNIRIHIIIPIQGREFIDPGLGLPSPNVTLQELYNDSHPFK